MQRCTSSGQNFFALVQEGQILLAGTECVKAVTAKNCEEPEYPALRLNTQDVLDRKVTKKKRHGQKPCSRKKTWTASITTIAV